MNKKIVLIGFYNEKALGVRYLANALTKAGYDPTIVFFKRYNSEKPELTTERELELLRDLIKKENPFFIGMSVMCSLYLEETDKVGAMIKENFDVPCVWGGLHSSVSPSV
ncbi:MAG: cobalamin-dependent protein, partial [Oscillospiraceae bacterium]|nr:cobalamin-dependent protein [Oscillospiraceae bacterium]